MKNSVASLDPVFHLWVSNTTSQEAIRWLLEVSIQFGAWAIFYRDMNNHQESPAVTNSGIYFPPRWKCPLQGKAGADFVLRSQVQLQALARPWNSTSLSDLDSADSAKVCMRRQTTSRWRRLCTMTNARSHRASAAVCSRSGWSGCWVFGAPGTGDPLGPGWRDDAECAPGDHSGFSNVPGEQLGAGSVRSIIQTLDISPSVVAGRLGMTSNTQASPLDALDILERSFKCPFCREVTATWAWMLAGRCLGRVVICCDSSPPRVPKGPTVPLSLCSRCWSACAAASTATLIRRPRSWRRKRSRRFATWMRRLGGSGGVKRQSLWVYIKTDHFMGIKWDVTRQHEVCLREIFQVTFTSPWRVANLRKLEDLATAFPRHHLGSWRPGAQ